ncbi:Gfo/Idh/MocA family oxidoreductase [Candidatus Bathyarchaeota archaeon]|nr:Gfo/Idh/MocA family oxidoreductase [Candidatus Bathyarchaeota archaeon]MBS7613116.1 Gfo/Idh/MocA family oxidoreductase [Candidatus Bathyarchaeota archaeon]MBS7618846.1 Gfo/Idh/MocA family oxidoreductase [Candidatus Bathyarchaeota archaeon]
MFLKVEKVRFGVIGLKGIGMTHIEAIKKCESAELLAVCDIVEELAKSIGEKYGVKWFTDYRELITLKDLDAVCVCTPHFLHHPMTLDALNASKHVLVEKPMAITVREADEMIEEAKARGLKLGVAFTYRTNPALKSVKSMVEREELGKLLRATLEVANYRTQLYYEDSPWRKNWKTSGAGVLINQTIHHLDVMCWLLGKPKRVAGFIDTKLHNIEVEDLASAALVFKNNCHATVQVSLVDNPQFDRMVVSGTKGKVILDFGSQLRIGISEPDVETHIRTSKEPWSRPKASWREVNVEGRGGHSEIIRDFTEAVKYGKKPLASGEDGIWSLEIVNAIVLSNFTGKIVDIPVDREDYDRLMDKLKSGLKLL